MHTLPSELVARLVSLRRDLHRHPELGHTEHGTMARISAALTTLGLPHVTGVAGTGIIADIDGLRPGPVIAIRADTDALPIQEQTGLPFASVHAGVMHACGHDVHSSMLVGAAALLLEERPPGPVRLVFQPAEELGTGARAMMAAGALQDVAAIFGGHVDVRYPPGTLIVTDGPVNASTDTFHIRVCGRGGHGARPHETIDAIVAAAAIVSALQTVVSRELPPGEAAVVSVGRIHGGTAPNVIAGVVELEGTLRALGPATRSYLSEALARVATAAAATHRATADVTFHRGTSPLVNRPDVTAIARDAAVRVVGELSTTRLDGPNMGGEDFAEYLNTIPGAYIRFGAAPGPDVYPAHSGRFMVHEDVIPVGAAWLDQVARCASTAVLDGMEFQRP